MCSAVGFLLGLLLCFTGIRYTGLVAGVKRNLPAGVAGQEVCRVLAGLVSGLSAVDQSANYNVPVP